MRVIGTALLRAARHAEARSTSQCSCKAGPGQPGLLLGAGSIDFVTEIARLREMVQLPIASHIGTT